MATLSRNGAISGKHAAPRIGRVRNLSRASVYNHLKRAADEAAINGD